MKYSAATQIIIVEYDPDIHKFKIINREEIPKSQFTLTNAVNKIVELNVKFNPHYIYVDRGYGEFQVETLHMYGDEHPETGLKDKVKGWAFSESYEIRDPITKLTRKTPIKPFMVNQVVYYLEQDLLMISDHDEMIYQQMENYQVVRVSASGQPVYTSENEHCIDALMLAILGFQLEFPQLAEIMRETKVARSIATANISIPDPLDNVDFGSYKKNKKREPVWDEPGAPPPKRVPVGYNPKKDGSLYSWGARGSSNRKAEPRRKMW